MSELSNKGFPPQKEVEDALLVFLKKRPSGVKTQSVYRELAKIMDIPDKQLSAKRDSEGRNFWENLVRYAHRRLKDHDLVNDGPRGLWSAKE